MKTRHNIAVGDIMAENIKINVGSALTELDEPPSKLPSAWKRFNEWDSKRSCSYI